MISRALYLLSLSLALLAGMPAHAASSLISDSLVGWQPAHPTQDYEIRDDPTVRHDGKPSVIIRALASTSKGFQGTGEVFDASAYIGKRIRFSAYLKTDGAISAALWTRIDGASGILGFDNMDDRAIVGTHDWAAYSIVLDVPDGSVQVIYGALLAGAGTLWISDIRVEVVSGDVPVTKTPVAAATVISESEIEAVAADLRTTAVPFAGDSPDLPLTDLAVVSAIVGDAHIVALGEGSHGSAQFFRMKHRILRYLVEKKGFTVFAIEASWSAALAVDDYIKTGHGSARAALDGLGFWTWDTREVLDMIQWMRRYNAMSGAHSTLSFAGIDMESPDGASAVLTNYMQQYDRADVARVNSALACLPRPGCQASVARVGALLDRKSKVLIAVSSEGTFMIARHAAAILEQAQAVKAGSIDRDAAMAKNVEWLARKRYAGQKLVIWAHNGHVAATSDALGYQTMGSHLRQSFGTGMVVFGLTFDSGTVRAFQMTGGRITGRPTPLPVAPAGFGFSEYAFHLAGMPRFILPLRNINATSALGRWLAQPQRIEMIGAVFDPALPHQHEVEIILPQAFDALVYFDKSDASQAL